MWQAFGETWAIGYDNPHDSVRFAEEVRRGSRVDVHVWASSGAKAHLAAPFDT